jgi:hypothetical protein
VALKPFKEKNAMPVIKRRQVEATDRYTFSLPKELKARLVAYSKYTNVSESEITAAALLYAIDSDKEFANTATVSGTEIDIASATPDARSVTRKTGALANTKGGKPATEVA